MITRLAIGIGAVLLAAGCTTHFWTIEAGEVASKRVGSSVELSGSFYVGPTRSPPPGPNEPPEHLPISTHGTGGACFIVDLGDVAAACTSDYQCNKELLPAPAPSHYRYCSKEHIGDQFGKCWTRPGPDLSFCRNSKIEAGRRWPEGEHPIVVIAPNGEHLPVVITDPALIGRPWRIHACLNSSEKGTGQDSKACGASPDLPYPLRVTDDGKVSRVN